MIGRPEWFERRKYGGWGLHPKTWQGWVYIAVFLIPFAVFHSMIWDDSTRIFVTIVWLGILLLDVVHIMINLKRDEREHKIEALSERNAAWTMVLIAAIGVLYQAISSGLVNTFNVDWFLVAVLFGGLIVKSISNLVLERRPL